jgi:hypothetical protein
MLARDARIKAVATRLCGSGARVTAVIYIL